MSSRTRLSFDVRLNDQGQTIKLSISDPRTLHADNLALATWGSSVVLANLLHRLKPDLHSIATYADCPSVIELGAGTGIVGLSAAAIWHTSVILTDLSPILPSLEANVELNHIVLAEHCGMALAGVLDWVNPDEMDIGHTGTRTQPNNIKRLQYMKAKILLAADTIYSEEHPELLVKVIAARLAPGPTSRVIMCYPLRVGYLDHIRDLWLRLEQAGLEPIEEGRESIHESWDEDTPYEWCVWRWKSATVP